MINGASRWLGGASRLEQKLHYDKREKLHYDKREKLHYDKREKLHYDKRGFKVAGGG